MQMGAHVEQCIKQPLVLKENINKYSFKVSIVERFLENVHYEKTCQDV